MELIPNCCASRLLVGAISSPLSLMVPEFFECTPVRILMSVDFPAPFSPMRACTSPFRRWKSTPSRALTPGKLLEIPVISKSIALCIGANGKRKLETERFVLVDVGRVDHEVVHADVLGKRLARPKGLDGVEDLVGVVGADGDAGVELAGLDGLDRVFDSAVGDHDDRSIF